MYSFRFYQSRFLAQLPKGITEEHQRQLLYPLYVDWVKERAHALAQDRMKRLTIQFQQEPHKIVIKDQKQR